jgi:hypothetical protein
MKETKTLLEANYFLFTEQLVDAVKDGWYVQSSNYGWVMESNGLKEITLFKDPGRVFPEAELGEFVISEYDTQTFLYKLCERIAQGGKVSLDSLYWDMTGIKSVKGTIFLIPKYNKAELANMEWETLKDVCKELGFTGRDRSVLVNKYLFSTGQEI